MARYTVISHFGAKLTVGTYLKCWVYSKLWVPVGWNITIEVDHA